MNSLIPESEIRPEFKDEPRQADYYQEPRNDWYLFIYGMANYTHRRIVALSEGSEAIPNQLDKIENGLITPGAGLQLSREMGKSFRVSAGIEYNQWIQEGNYSTTVPFEQVELVVNTATQASEYTFEGNISGSLGNTSFASTSDENPFQTGFETLSPNSELTFNVQTRRRIDYLSIPINLEYVYNAYPFTFTVGAGVSINPIIGSSLEYSTADSLPEIYFRNEEEISGTYLAFQAGIGIEYGLSERMAIRLNPTYRGWMNPIFENEAIRTLPFGVAIRAGLVYQFGKK
jgi:opacity protein-like surface antigen